VSAAIPFKLTVAGQDAAFNLGAIDLNVTHVQLGSGNHSANGNEIALVTPQEAVAISGHFEVAVGQHRIAAVIPGSASAYQVSEIGLWSGVPGAGGSVLVFYWSLATGYIAHKDAGIDFNFESDILFGGVVPGNITIVADTQFNSLAMLAAHEADPNAHPIIATPPLGDNDQSPVNSEWVQQTIGKVLSKSVAGSADVTLTAAEAGHGVLLLTGAITGNLAVIVPDAPTRDWIVRNDTTGAFAIAVKTEAGSGVVVAQGADTPMYTHGTDVLYDTSIVPQPEAVAGVATTLRGWSALRVSQAIAANMSSHGQCRLSVASTTSLNLAPFNGNNLIIVGVRRQFTSAAGVSISNAGLTANTVYYVYATWDGAAIELALSTTGHVTSDSGVEVKSTDADSTLVGMIRTNASSQFVDTQAQRFCINWFNRKVLGGNQGFAANRSTTSTGLVEISSSERLEFLAWAYEVTYLASPVNLYQNTVAAFASSLYVDGGSYSNQVITPPAIDAVVFLCPQFPYAAATDGYHYASVYGAAATGFTATWKLSTTVLTALIMG
jgi:hypothetical protein